MKAEYLVIEISENEKKLITTGNKDIPPGNNLIPSGRNPQSRVKESREEKSKVEERKRGREESPPHLFSEDEIFLCQKFEAKLLNSIYEQANVEWYHEQINNWSLSKNEKKINWLAAAKNWMASDMRDGKFITKDFKPKENGNSNGTKQSTGAAVDTRSAFAAIDRHFGSAETAGGEI